MEANSNSNEVKYNFCKHIRNQFFNIFSTTILQFQENKNFFELYIYYVFSILFNVQRLTH